jgi:plasmid stabilization system protein ParE
MKVIWTKEALARLIEIEEFLAQNNPKNAEKFINCLIE